MITGGQMYAISKLAAAKEIARNPCAIEDVSLREKICRHYGFSRESMPHSEAIEFDYLIISYMRHS